MKLIATLAAVAVAGVTLAAAPSVAQAVDAPGFDIKLVSLNGSGCKAGETPAPRELTVKDNKVVLTNRYLDMITAAGANTPRSEGRKNCQYAFQVTPPQGYTYALESFVLRGSTYIEKGATAQLQLNAYIQGQSGTQTRKVPVPGLFAERFVLGGTFDDDEMQWAPCTASRNLNVNVSTTVDPGTQSADSYSWVRQDEKDGVELALALKKC